MDRAIFLDRDNTILEDKEGYLGDPAKVKLLPGAATALAAMRRLGYRIIVASNQSGVARGMFDEAAVENVNQEMCKHLREQAGAHIDASYYCPYHPEASVPQYRMDHEWRKPKAGMLKQAAEDFSIDLSQSWMIGDQPRDIACGAAANCRTILLKDPDHLPPDADTSTLAVSPNFIVKTLADAARIIAREGKNPHPDLVPLPLSSEPTTAAAEASVETETPAPAAVETPAPALAVMPVPASAPSAPNSAPSTPAPSVPSGPVVDSAAIAREVAVILAKLTPHGQPESIKPTLEEILHALRQQSRAADMPEFSATRLFGILLQLVVPLCMALALWDAFATMQAHAASVPDWYTCVLLLLRAGLWLLAALILQLCVLTLHMTTRSK